MNYTDLEWEYLKYKKEHEDFDSAVLLNENVRFHGNKSGFHILLTPSKKHPGGFYFKFLMGDNAKKFMNGARISLKEPVYVNHDNDNARLVIINTPVIGDYKTGLINFMNMSVFNYVSEINQDKVLLARQLAIQNKCNYTMYRVLIMCYNEVYDLPFEKTVNLFKKDSYNTSLYIPIDWDMPDYSKLPDKLPKK